MAYWLVKSEPETWSWDQQVKSGAKGEPWTGVRNHTAKLNLMKMKKGDRAFFYHSGDEKAVVGVVEVVKEHYLDPTDKTGKFYVVDFKAIGPFPKHVTLAAAKADPKLAEMSLITSFRLSVQPVTDAEWKHVCKLGGFK